MSAFVEAVVYCPERRMITRPLGSKIRASFAIILSDQEQAAFVPHSVCVHLLTSGTMFHPFILKSRLGGALIRLIEKPEVQSTQIAWANHLS